MGLLFRLPLLLFEYLLRRLSGGGQDSSYAPVVTPEAAAAAARPAPPPPPVFVGDTGAPADPPPPTADEAIERREEREAAAATTGTGSVTPLRPISESRNGHVDTEPELVESFGPSGDVGDVGGTITVEEPWDGYATQPASAIVQRLRGADPATKAVVALYERGHKNRATILKATG
jgi:hypothetical protein